MIGRQIAHYRIEAELGRGGMGVVYRAHDETLGRDVALKVVRADDRLEPAAHARLIREARTASRLNHPHICTVYEAGESAGQVYVAMELIVGRSLAAEIPPEGLPVETVVRYGAQIADALAHAHDQGVVHRDLKPANIMITREGRAKVLDFGLARRLPSEELDAVTHSQLSAGETGVVAGSLPYMAPEQLRGEPADVRSDVWALGLVLYEMATGHRPFSARSGYELSAKILRESLPTLPAHLPQSLALVVQRCLAKESAQRYQHAREVRAALEPLQFGLGTAGVAVPQAPAATPAQASATVGAGAEDQKPAGSPELRKYWWVIVLVVLSPGLWKIVDGAIEGIREAVRERQQAVRPAELPHIQSIAVLPLENLSGDPNQEYFADGMTEALISELAQIRKLRVISRTSVMQYKGARKSLPEIAKDLNVDAVVEGSVQRSGDRVAVNVQLIYAPNDRHLWAKPYERDLRNVLTLQREMARAIASEIQLQLTPQEEARLAPARPVDPEAHEAYLKGRYHARRYSLDSIPKSVESFEQAIAIDPTYAPAYAGLADMYATLVFTGLLPPKELYAKAKVAATKALALDETLAEAHAALGWTELAHDWNWSGAEREFRRALELNPSSTTALFDYSILLSVEGRDTEAIALAERGQAVDPLSPLMITNVGWRYLSAHQYDKAIECFRKALELDPNFAVAQSCIAYTLLMQGMPEKAVREFKAGLVVDRTPISRMWLAHAYVRAGRRNQAVKVLAELKDRARQGYVSPYAIAGIHAALGEKELAFQWLERAYEDRDAWLLFITLVPDFDTLRSDPRFQNLLRRMSFPR